MGRTLPLPSHIIVTHQMWHKLQRLAAFKLPHNQRVCHSDSDGICRQVRQWLKFFISHFPQSNLARKNAQNAFTTQSRVYIQNFRVSVSILTKIFQPGRRRVRPMCGVVLVLLARVPEISFVQAHAVMPIQIDGSANCSPSTTLCSAPQIIIQIQWSDSWTYTGSSLIVRACIPFL